MITVVLLFYIVFAVYIVIVLIRLRMVHSTRMEIINRIYEESLRNIEDGTYELYGSTEAYKRKDEVSYNGSVFKIWRSVKSFYDEDYIINGVKKDV